MATVLAVVTARPGDHSSSRPVARLTRSAAAVCDEKGERRGDQRGDPMEPSAVQGAAGWGQGRGPEPIELFVTLRRLALLCAAAASLITLARRANAASISVAFPESR